MADIKRIKLPNGTTYNLKDSAARTSITNITEGTTKLPYGKSLSITNDVELNLLDPDNNVLSTVNIKRGGTDVFSGDNIAHGKVKVTVSGFTTEPSGKYTATVITQSDVTNIVFTNKQGTSTEYTSLDTLYSDLKTNNYYEFEFVNNSGNAMPSNELLSLNSSGGNSIGIQNSNYKPFSGDDSPFGGYCGYKGYGSAAINIVSVSEDHYSKLKIIDPLEVKKVNGVNCLTAPRIPALFNLSYSNGLWELTDEDGTTHNYNDLRVGDIVYITRNRNPLPSDTLYVLSPYSDDDKSNPKQYIKYVSCNMYCRVVKANSLKVILQAPPVNYATSQGDAGSHDGSYETSNIYANSSEDDIAAELRYLKNVVEEDDFYTNYHYMLYGYGPDGAITNFNTHIHRIVYDDGSFAAIYYPEAGTIPDGIKPGFTWQSGSTPPVGNWNPLIAYDSMFFYSGNEVYSTGLEYNGQGFYGTPTSGTGFGYTSNTNYIIAFGHFNNQYMAIE